MVDKETSFVEGHSLRYDWDNYEMMCEELGLNTLAEIEEFYKPENINKISLKTLRIMVWAGLRREDNPIKKTEVGPIITQYLKEHSLADLLVILITAQMESGLLGGKEEQQGEVQGEQKKKPPKLSKN